MKNQTKEQELIRERRLNTQRMRSQLRKRNQYLSYYNFVHKTTKKFK